MLNYLLIAKFDLCRTQSMQSVDFYASSEEGGFEEGGGPPGAKINEYQAAWNVTNAIQVFIKTYYDERSTFLLLSSRIE